MKAKVAKERNCKDKAKENGHNRGLRAEISPSQVPSLALKCITWE